MSFCIIPANTLIMKHYTKIILKIFALLVIISSSFFCWSNGQGNVSHISSPLNSTLFNHSKDTIRPSVFIISGSFLIPSNAANRKNELARLGFKNVYIKNFTDSEYYSVVVDHFNNEEEAQALGDKLRGLKQAYFIKNTGEILMLQESK